MTDRETLEKTLELWKFLRKHPEATKELAYRILKMREDLFFCPLCEQARIGDTSNPDCNKCLLYGFWPDKNKCINPVSIYYRWTNAQNRISRTFFAHLIVLALKDKLKNY